MTQRSKRQAEQVKAGGQARRAAMARLIAYHQEEYDRLFEEEAKKRGITTRAASRERKKERLREELSRLEGL